MKKIFIDGGAHKGEAIKMLLNKREDLNNCDIHFFEPNIRLVPILKKIDVDKYNIFVHNSALWDEDGEIDFINSIGRWKTLAGTVVPEMNEIRGLKLDRDNSEKVKTTSLVNFLKQFDEVDYVVIKLDVEGSEYRIIDDLLKNGDLNKINELHIEWHDHFFPHLKKMGLDLKDKLSKTNIKIFNNWP